MFGRLWLMCSLAMETRWAYSGRVVAIPYRHHALLKFTPGEPEEQEVEQIEAVTSEMDSVISDIEEAAEDLDTLIDEL